MSFRYHLTLVSPRREHRLGTYGASEAAQIMADFDSSDDVAYVRSTYVDSLSNVPRTWTDKDGKVHPNRRAKGWGPTPLEITVEIAEGEEAGPSPTSTLGYLKNEAGRERLESEGWQVTDWGAA